MDINLLRNFLSVAQTQSIRESAALIGISPAGLSKGIKNLEHRLGCALIEAQGRGIKLTAQGLNFAGELEPRLRALEQALVLDTAIAPSHRLRIATFEIFSTHILGRVVKCDDRFSEIEIIESVPGEMEKLILENRADIGISTNPAPRNGLTYLKATTFHSRVFVGAKSHLRDVDIAELPFVVPFPPPQGSASRAIGLDGWPAQRPRHIAYRVSMMETALALCKHGQAAGFFPESVVAIYNECLQPAHRLVPHLCKVDGGGKLDVFIVVRCGDEELGCVKFLAKELRLISKLKV